MYIICHYISLITSFHYHHKRPNYNYSLTHILPSVKLWVIGGGGGGSGAPASDSTAGGGGGAGGVAYKSFL